VDVRTQKSKKLRVAVLYGGKSGEHEISLRSAESIFRNLDLDRFEVVKIFIGKDGIWTQKGRKHATGITPLHAFDVVFPVLHGPLGEDGTLQGLLELAEVPYVGAGVLGSAIGMDKEVAKRLARDAGLPIVPFQSLKKNEWETPSHKALHQLKRKFGFPVFIKPSNMGSSVGVHLVKTAVQLPEALRDAFRYDTKVLIEKAIDAREIEVAVLESASEGAPPQVSAPGEVIPHHAFYSYEAKYLDPNGATLKIPAQLSNAQKKKAQNIAGLVFNALECEGMGRVDLLLEKKTGKFYFNEINTIPGFTSISMYPKLLEASGISYQALLSQLIDLGLKRHHRKQALQREFLISPFDILD
jgi:D-alanine-D-alanine ligase